MGAGQRFEVTVVALDRFTKTFRDLNNSASKAARPFVNVQRKVGALAREAHLDKAAKGIGKVSDAAVTFTRTLGLSLGPLESVLGIGTAGGIVGGLLATGGAAVGLGVRFAGMGFEVSRTAQRLGVSTDELQGYRGAARLAGLDANVMTGAIASLGDTLQDAKFGRNPVALQMLNKFGMAIHTNRDGVVDTMATMRELSGVLQNVADPHVAAIIARGFGLEDALPLLRQGPAAIDKLVKSANDLGGVAGPGALQWSVDFTNSLNRMKLAIDGVSNSLGARMVPAMTRAVDVATDMISGKKVAGRSPSMGPITSAARLAAALMGQEAPSLDPALSGVIRGPTRARVGLSQVAVKRNNPGNLRSWGAAPTVGGFAQFSSPEEGLLAMNQQLGLYGDRGFNTVRSIISRYAPRSENNTGAYIDDVSKKTGMKPDQALDLSDRAVLASVVAAMVSHEQGQQPFTPDQYASAAKQSIELHVHVPPGASVKARSSTDNAYLPTKISYSMPSGDMP